MLLSGVMLLRHVGLNEQAGRLEKAIHDILLRGKVLTKYARRPSSHLLESAAPCCLLRVASWA